MNKTRRAALFQPPASSHSSGTRALRVCNTLCKPPTKFLAEGENNQEYHSQEKGVARTLKVGGCQKGTKVPICIQLAESCSPHETVYQSHWAQEHLHRFAVASIISHWLMKMCLAQLGSLRAIDTSGSLFPCSADCKEPPDIGFAVFFVHEDFSVIHAIY